MTENGDVSMMANPEMFMDYHHIYNSMLMKHKNLEHAYIQALFNHDVSINKEAISDYADSCLSISGILIIIGQFKEAEKYCRVAIRLKPKFAEAYNNYGIILVELGCLNDAEIAYRHAIYLNSALVSAYENLHRLLYMLDRPVEALNIEARTKVLADNTLLKAYKVRLLLFDLFKGQRFLEKGTGVREKKILVFQEYGLGDFLMTMRFLPFFKQHGAKKVMVQCDPQLRRIVRLIPEIDIVFCTNSEAENIDYDDFDYYCLSMELIQHFHSATPISIPYVNVPKIMIRSWCHRMTHLSGFKVGLVWAGNNQYKFDNQRSIPLHMLSRLKSIQGIEWVSLQQGEAVNEITTTNWIMYDGIRGCDDLLDTAAIISNLDLVIGVDTAVIHLAGALGKPVWLLNRYNGDWRWREEEQPPWYPKIRVFYQQEPNDWSYVINEVYFELDNIQSYHGRM